ncbi:MAG: hypothetical protein NT144_02445 [Bacteroidia bacterium]|nr:hypothetical protein [Bacteroidia bacterium]
MKVKLILSPIFLVIFVTVICAQATISIDFSKKEDPVSRRIFGLFTEHIGNNVYQGAWAQIIENPAFVPAGYWPVRNGKNWIEEKIRNAEEIFSLVGLGKDAANGFGAFWASSGNLEGRLLKEGIRDIQKITSGDGGGSIQTGIFPPLHRTESYRISLTARSDTPSEVIIEVLNVKNEKFGEVALQLDTCWRTIEKSLSIQNKQHHKGDPYVLRVVFKPHVNVELSRLLLFPGDHAEGWDPEVVGFIKNMNLPLLRFPGGNFVSGYNWRDGVGPIEQRPVLPNPAWPIMEWNHVGTDEWIRFCKLIDCEPMICVNAGNGMPQDAGDWVRYCNDQATTEMGSLRAKNGSPEPYNVKVWEVGNELCGPWQIGFTDGEGYARRYAEFAQELLKADPGIKLIANGQIRVLEKSQPIDRGNNFDWNRKLMHINGNLVQSISVHSLVGKGGITDDNAEPEEFLRDLVAFAENYPNFLNELIVKPMKEVGVKPNIAITELMDWTTSDKVGNVTSISGALWYSAIINVCIKSDGLIDLVTRSALINHGGGLSKDRGIVYTQPVYWAHYMYSAQQGTIPISVTIDSPTFNSTGKYVIKRDNIQAIDAAALIDTEGKSASVFVCNRDTELGIEVSIQLKGFDASENAEVMMINCDDLALRNSWEKPEQIMPSFKTVKISQGKIVHKLPPLSLARFVIKKNN